MLLLFSLMVLSCSNNDEPVIEVEAEIILNKEYEVEFNLDGTIVTANENFLQTVGYRLEEIEGRHHRVFVTPQYANSSEYNEEFAEVKSKKRGRKKKETMQNPHVN